MLFNLLGRLSNSGNCSCEFDFGQVYSDYDYHIALREEMMLKIPHEYPAELVRFSCNGKTMDDINVKAAAWMSPSSPSFHLGPTAWEAGNKRVYVVSWNATQVKPGVQNIPWIKLFHYSPSSGVYEGYAYYVTDLAHAMDPRLGKTEVVLPGNLRKGTYFFIVGDYRYRTEIFEVLDVEVGHSPCP